MTMMIKAAPAPPAMAADLLPPSFLTWACFVIIGVSLFLSILSFTPPVSQVESFFLLFLACI